MHNKELKLLTAIKQLWGKINKRRRIQIYLLLALMICSSIAEIFSFGILFPFLGMLSAPDEAFNHPFVIEAGLLIGAADRATLTLLLAIAFCGAALFSGLMRITVLYATNRFSAAISTEMTVEAYKRTLYQEYSKHISTNTSELINGIVNKTTTVTSVVIVQLLGFVSSIFYISAIMAALLVTNTVVAIVAGSVASGMYIVIIFLTKKMLRRNGEVIAKESSYVIRALQEGLGGIRDVLIDGTQNTYVEIYRRSDLPLRLALARNVLISGSPRFVVETIGMILIAGFALWLSHSGDFSSSIPMLGVLALGAQRLMPALQLCFSSLAIIRGSEASIRDVVALLDQPLPPDSAEIVEPLNFTRDLELRSVTFSYEEGGREILSDITLTIRKGDRVGLFGVTGSGKSTLLDIMMGLLTPTSGSLMVDGEQVNSKNQQEWRRRVAHVPQQVFLADAAIAENIAFGVDAQSIDMDRVVSSARLAQLSATINAMPDGYKTSAGERGVRLSGGQRQRLGVARALYKSADFIILDEATSALDTATEEKVMEEINALRGVTIVMVAHRISTLQYCDVIYEIADGKLVRSGTYSELFAA